MRIQVKTDAAREKAIQQWRRWFAWRPVYAFAYDPTARAERKYLVWLAMVERIRWRPAHAKARWRYRM